MTQGIACVWSDGCQGRQNHISALMPTTDLDHFQTWQGHLVSLDLIWVQLWRFCLLVYVFNGPHMVINFGVLGIFPCWSNKVPYDSKLNVCTKWPNCPFAISLFGLLFMKAFSLGFYPGFHLSNLVTFWYKAYGCMLQPQKALVCNWNHQNWY